MAKIMVITVGGSPTPIIRSITEYRPEFVYFICSGGSLPKGTEEMVNGAGDPCGDKTKATCPECRETFHLGNPKGKSIVLQTSLKNEQYKIFTLEDPDDLTECYKTIDEISLDIEHKFGGGHEVIANYTGGTKTMSVALAYCACCKPEWKLGLSIGPREDTTKVKDHDIFVPVDKTIAIVEYQLRRVRFALRDYDYAQADDILRSLLQEKPLDPRVRRKLMDLHRRIEVFNLWDHFMHPKALELIQATDKTLSSYVVQLKDIMGRLKKGGNVFAKVADLLNNARRKAFQKTYDDAIARLYRAVEMFAQVIMKSEYGLDSNSLSIDDIEKPDVKEKYRPFSRENKRLPLGLDKSYELLADYGHAAGILFLQKRSLLLDALSKRNLSYLAHGEIPLDQNDYDKVWRVLHEFLLDCASRIGADIEAPQFPREELLKAY